MIFQAGQRTRWWNLATFVFAWIVALVAVGGSVYREHIPPDSWLYWLSWHQPLYVGMSMPYAPPVALLFAPAALMPLRAFEIFWQAVLLAAAAWLMWPLPVRLRIPYFVALAGTTMSGNIAILLAVPLALAPRYPALWGFVAWVKLTPEVAALYLLRQRSWRDAAVAVAPAAALGVLMLLFQFDLMSRWVAFLRSIESLAGSVMPGIIGWSLPVTYRLPFAALVAWWGRGRGWTIAVAATIGMPDINLATLALLGAIPRLEAYTGPGATTRVVDSAAARADSPVPSVTVASTD